MSLLLEMPAAMRSRIIKEARSTIGGQLLSPSDSIIKRITQPKIPVRELASHIPDIRAWLQAWKDEEASVQGLSLSTTRKSSCGLTFTMPSGISFATLSDYVAWTGSSEDYRVAGNRISRLAELDERLLGMSRAWQSVVQLSDPDFLSFVELLRWRRNNPDSRPPVRALAIPGLDSKWIEKNRSLVGPAFRMIGAFDPEGASDIEKLGFDTCDRMTVWFRCGAGIGGLADFASQFALRPSETSAEQFPGAHRLIVIENQTSFETLVLENNDVAIFGQGGQAPAALGLMPWLTGTFSKLIYWGDMDGEGYRILSRARAALGGITSILMDGDCVKKHMEKLSIAIDPDLRPVPIGLTPEETEGYHLVAGPGRRIEQERLPAWTVAEVLCDFQQLRSQLIA